MTDKILAFIVIILLFALIFMINRIIKKNEKDNDYF